MSLASPYAVVADRETMADLLGLPSYPYFGVCVVQGNVCECHYPRDEPSLFRLVGHLPAVPSGYSGSTPAITAMEEDEALDCIREEAPPIPSHEGLPPGFQPAVALHAMGLSYRTGTIGTEIRLHSDTARLLGWTDGEKLALGMSTCGAKVAIAPSASAAFRLEAAEDPAWLESDREIPGLECLPDSGGWRDLSFRILDGCIVFQVPAMEPPAIPAGDSREAVVQQGQPAARARTAALLAAAMVGFTLGAIAI